MSEEKKLMDEQQLDNVSGGVTANLAAAYDVLAGKYSAGEERKRMLVAAGYNYNEVQALVNALWKGYGPVANDVINGKYGDNAARRANLLAAGYNPDEVQNLVNNMLWR